MSLGIADRVKAVIDSETDKRGKFAQLESLTTITAENWKSFYYGRQRPNADMIEAVARTWPQYALWIATGISDPEYGQGAPESSGFPTDAAARENSTSLLRKRLELKQAAVEIAYKFLEVEDLGEIGLSDRMVRMAVSILTKCEDEYQIDLGRYKAAQDAHRQAEKLRRAELIIHNELADSDYELTEALLDKADRLMKSATPDQSAKLAALMVKEREAIERHQAFNKKNPDIARRSAEHAIKNK